MFDMGFWEIALIFILLLLVVGPDKLPGLARTIGLWVGKARSLVSSVKREVEQEMRLQDIQRSLSQHSATNEIKRLADQVRSINSEVRSVSTDIKTSIEKSTAQSSAAIPTPTSVKTPAVTNNVDTADNLPSGDSTKSGTMQEKTAQENTGQSPSTSNNASNL